MTTERITMPVHGLSFGGSRTLDLERVIAEVSGVTRVYVNPSTETAYLEYDLDRFRLDQLMAAVERVGSRLGAVRHH